MHLDLLHTFLDVARLGSFAAVARERDVDPSSISRNIQTLEDELGYRLFVRSTRKLMLTEAGSATRERLQAPLTEIENIRASGLDMVARPSGLLRVTASSALGERWLVPRLAAFRAKYPEIEFDLLLTDRRVDLREEHVDLALRLGETVDGDYVMSRLVDTRYRVVATPDFMARANPQIGQPDDLADHDCIVFPIPGYRSTWRFRQSDGATQEVPVQPALTISSAMGIRRATLEHLGVALLADWCLGNDIEAGRLVDLFPDIEVSAANFETAIWIAYPTRDYVPAKLRVFIDHLRGSV